MVLLKIQNTLVVEYNRYNTCKTLGSISSTDKYIFLKNEQKGIFRSRTIDGRDTLTEAQFCKPKPPRAECSGYSMNPKEVLFHTHEKSQSFAPSPRDHLQCRICQSGTVTLMFKTNGALPLPLSWNSAPCSLHSSSSL